MVAQSPANSSPAAQRPAWVVPPLSPEEDRLFEALATGCTTPAALCAKLDLPARTVLQLLASQALIEAVACLDAATDLLDRHTTRLRHQAAFESLQAALTLAVTAGNPGEIRRIAVQLLKPTPPLPDPEVEHAERAERITKSRRAVKEDAREDARDAEDKAFLDSICPKPTMQQVRAARTNVPSAPVPSASSRWSGRDSNQSPPVHTQPLATPPAASPPPVTGHTSARPQAA